MSEARLRNYKNKGKEISDLRRQRSEASVELRKAKKDEQMSKRRNLIEEEEEVEVAGNQALSKPTVSLEECTRVLGLLNNFEDVLCAVYSIRRLLSTNNDNPPIDKIINAGVLPILTRLLLCNDKPDLQLEAAWALTNVASGTPQQTRSLVATGAVDNFVYLLAHENFNIIDQSIWALGNIAGDCAELRDVVLNTNTLDSIINLIQRVLTDSEGSLGLSLLRNIAWMMGNFFRHKNPQVPGEIVRKCLPALVNLLHHPDTLVKVDTCWAISYICDGDEEQVNDVISCGILSGLSTQLEHTDVSLVVPALRALGNVVTGNEMQTQAALDVNVLPKLKKLLSHSKSTVQKEASWMVSNVAAGSLKQIQEIINAGLLPFIVGVIEKAEFRAQREAIWVINNMASGGTVHQKMDVINSGAIQAMSNLLNCKDAKLITVILEAVGNLLEASSQSEVLDDVCIMFEECGGLDKVEGLQQHDNETVYNMSQALIDKYFCEEENEEAVASNEGGFNFASNNNNQGGGFKF